MRRPSGDQTGYSIHGRIEGEARIARTGKRRQPDVPIPSVVSRRGNLRPIRGNRQCCRIAVRNAHDTQTLSLPVEPAELRGSSDRDAAIDQDSIVRCGKIPKRNIAAQLLGDRDGLAGKFQAAEVEAPRQQRSFALEKDLASFAIGQRDKTGPKIGSHQPLGQWLTGFRIERTEINASILRGR